MIGALRVKNFVLSIFEWPFYTGFTVLYKKTANLDLCILSYIPIETGGLFSAQLTFANLDLCILSYIPIETGCLFSAQLTH